MVVASAGGASWVALLSVGATAAPIWLASVGNVAVGSGNEVTVAVTELTTGATPWVIAAVGWLLAETTDPMTGASATALVVERTWFTAVAGTFCAGIASPNWVGREPGTVVAPAECAAAAERAQARAIPRRSRGARQKTWRAPTVHSCRRRAEPWSRLESLGWLAHSAPCLNTHWKSPPNTAGTFVAQTGCAFGEFARGLGVIPVHGRRQDTSRHRWLCRWVVVKSARTTPRLGRSQSNDAGAQMIGPPRIGRGHRLTKRQPLVRVGPLGRDGFGARGLVWVDIEVCCGPVPQAPIGDPPKCL